MNSAFPVAVLASSHLLRQFANGEGESLTAKDFERYAMVDVWDRFHHYPDHMRQSTFAYLYGKAKYPFMLYKSIEHLADSLLDWRGDSIVVKEECFEKWQNVISEVSPLLIMACHIVKAPAVYALDDERLRTLITTNIQPHVFPGFAAPLLDAAIEREGLYDIHVHLNGCTPSDTIWQDALERPRLFRFQLQSEWRASKHSAVEELFQQVSPHFQRQDIPNLVDIATNLRHWMVRCIFSEDAPPSERPLMRYTLSFPHAAQERRRHILEDMFPAITFGLMDSLQIETLFLVHLLRRFKNGESDYLARCAHYYFLIQHYVNRLLVQQTQQIGFDQFQKITENGLRELAEKEYIRRLQQFHSCAKPATIHVEGRFAPKDRFEKLVAMLQTIHKAVEKYQKDYSQKNLLGVCTCGSKHHTVEYPLQLKLVAHFIKQPDKPLNMGCRYYRYRRSLQKQARLLLLYRERKLAPVWVGADAAANEMHTAPEVFAPTFRYLRRHGITNFTYHVGEDYKHLVSGVRAIDEALTFLELGSGARIGHATAIGIDPALWIERVGDDIALERTEWLDTLVYAHHHLLREGIFTGEVDKIRDQIAEHSRYVYGSTQDAYVLWKAWELRSLDPLRAFVDTDLATCIHPEEQKEWDDIKKARNDYPEAFQLFSAYNGRFLTQCMMLTRPCADNVRQFCKKSEQCPCPHRSNRSYNAYKAYSPYARTESACPMQKCQPDVKNPYISVETNFFSAEAMMFLQKNVLSTLAQKQVAIESMISSNVRISYYKKYDEHHIVRWLGMNERFKQEPHPIVCLGTDDPGIFATTIRNECLHLLRILRKKNVAEPEAVDIIVKLLKNSNAFLFTPSPPSPQSYNPSRKEALIKALF